MGKMPYSKLKGYLVENNIRQKEVAALLGVTESTLSSKINRNGQDFTLEQVALLCKTYNLDPNEFFLQIKLSKEN